MQRLRGRGSGRTNYMAMAKDTRNRLLQGNAFGDLPRAMGETDGMGKVSLSTDDSSQAADRSNAS